MKRKILKTKSLYVISKNLDHALLIQV